MLEINTILTLERQHGCHGHCLLNLVTAMTQHRPLLHLVTMMTQHICLPASEHHKYKYKGLSLDAECLMI